MWVCGYEEVYVTDKKNLTSKERLKKLWKGGYLWAFPLAIIGYFLVLPDLVAGSAAEGKDPIYDYVLFFGIFSAVWFFLLRELFAIYSLHLKEQGHRDKHPLIVRLANSEWLKAFVIGVASSLCASMIMLLLFKAS